MMRALIQPRFRTLRIEEEAENVIRKFNPKSSLDLERVAREEYGVIEVVKTPLVFTSTLRKTDEGLYIFYNASFKPYECIH